MQPAKDMCLKSTPFTGILQFPSPSCSDRNHSGFGVHKQQQERALGVECPRTSQMLEQTLLAGTCWLLGSGLTPFPQEEPSPV